MRKSVKLVSLLLCLTLFFSYPFSAYAGAGSFQSAEVQCKFDNDQVVSNSGRNGVAISLSPGIYSRMVDLTTNYTFLVTGDAGDTVTVTASIKGYVTRVTGTALVYSSGVANKTSTINGNTLKFSFELLSNCDKQPITVSCSMIVNSVDSSHGLSNAAFGWDMDLSVKSETNSMLSSISEWVEGIFDDIQDLPNKIGDFFSSLTSSLSSWFDDVGDWFTQLGNNIKEWFSDLGDRISGFFTNLGNSISGFFEKLWNRIYWGNENGEAEYQPPVFGSSLDDVLDTLDGYITQLDDTNDQIESATDTSVAYVEQGTTVINSVFGVFPSIVTALVIFGVVFIFCRKVVGR